jgi:hypothetical protein
LLLAWLFASLSTKALRELKRDGTVQAWGEKDFKSNWAKGKLPLAYLFRGQGKPKEKGFKELQGVKP